MFGTESELVTEQWSLLPFMRDYVRFDVFTAVTMKKGVF
jgi:hypothetical protein